MVCLALFMCCLQLKQKVEESKQAMERIKRDIRAMCTGSLGIGQRVVAIENNLREVSHRQTKVEQREPELASYSHAAKLVEMGATLEEVTATCGLTRAEAELLMIVHKKEEKNISFSSVA